MPYWRRFFNFHKLSSTRESDCYAKALVVKMGAEKSEYEHHGSARLRNS